MGVDALGYKGVVQHQPLSILLGLTGAFAPKLANLVFVGCGFLVATQEMHFFVAAHAHKHAPETCDVRTQHLRPHMPLGVHNDLQILEWSLLYLLWQLRRHFCSRLHVSECRGGSRLTAAEQQKGEPPQNGWLVGSKKSSRCRETLLKTQK